MPLHSLPVSRREFLARGAAALAGLTVLRVGHAADATEPVKLALLSDTHIPASPEIVARDVNMTAHLKQVVAEVLQLGHKPSAVIINGDCAYNKGLPEDYVNFAGCVQPLMDAGIPLHMTMGNHDDREPFYTALSGQRQARPIVDSRHVSIIETPFADLYLLDTLKQTNVVTGELGEIQRAWLAQALDARADKPAILIAHHTPQFTPPTGGNPWGGMADTAEFFELIASKKQVKAFIYGHSHQWSIEKRDGLCLVNLPPVAYIFKEGAPNGWVNAKLHAGGLSLEMRTIDPTHKLNRTTAELAWS